MPQEREIHRSKPKHLSAVLKSKELWVFEEVLMTSGYGDTSIASETGRGFDLTEPIPTSGELFKPIVGPASMS